MDAEQLWETTLNPENRVLKRVEIGGCPNGVGITEMLMEATYRRDGSFIYDRG